MDWRKVYWIFFCGKVLTFQDICPLLLSVREVFFWEMSAFIIITVISWFFLLTGFIPRTHLYFAKRWFRLSTVLWPEAAILVANVPKGQASRYIASLRKTGQEEIGIFAYSLLGFVRKVYILDDCKFNKSKYPGVWHQGRKHIKNGNFFATVSPDG